MAKFIFTIEDAPGGGVETSVESVGKVDTDNPTNAALLAMLVNKFIADELADDFNVSDE